MLAFALRRLLQSIPVFIGIILICTVLLRFSGDPINMIMPQRATIAERELKREELGLNRPWYVQLGHYLKGDFGRSYRHDRPVRDMILEGASVTARVTLGALVFATTLGLLSGLFSAYYPRSAWDYFAAVGASTGVAIPAFWLAMLLTLVFAVKLEWLPIGSNDPKELKYFVIPVVTLGLISTALIARLSRGCMLETLSQDYVRTARAKGVSRPGALLGHAFPNAMVPIFTVIGNDLAALMSGAVLTETTTGLPGIGRVIYQAISEVDQPVIIGGCLFCAGVFVIANLCVDLLYGYLDPRIRQHG